MSINFIAAIMLFNFSQIVLKDSCLITTSDEGKQFFIDDRITKSLYTLYLLYNWSFPLIFCIQSSEAAKFAGKFL